MLVEQSAPDVRPTTEGAGLAVSGIGAMTENIPRQVDVIRHHTYVCTARQHGRPTHASFVQLAGLETRFGTSSAWFLARATPDGNVVADSNDPREGPNSTTLVLNEERRAIILQLLHERCRVEVRDLSRHFSTIEATVRGDL